MIINLFGEKQLGQISGTFYCNCFKCEKHKKHHALGMCKKCYYNKHSKEYYYKNHEKMRRYHKNWYQKNHEKMKRYHRNYRTPYEKCSRCCNIREVYARNYSNFDVICNSCANNLRKENGYKIPEKKCSRCKNTRSTFSNNSFGFEVLCQNCYIGLRGRSYRKFKPWLVANFGCKCHCIEGVHTCSYDDLVVDHIHPISKKDTFEFGDINDIINLQTLCKKHNLEKSNKIIPEYQYKIIVNSYIDKMNESY